MENYWMANLNIQTFFFPLEIPGSPLKRPVYPRSHKGLSVRENMQLDRRSCRQGLPTKATFQHCFSLLSCLCHYVYSSWKEDRRATHLSDHVLTVAFPFIPAAGRCASKSKATTQEKQTIKRSQQNSKYSSINWRLQSITNKNKEIKIRQPYQSNKQSHFPGCVVNHQSLFRQSK